KQTMVNPWIEFVEKHPIGSTVQGKVKNVTNYGVFVGLTDQLDGMVYVNDIDWELRGDEALQLYSEGDEVEVKVQDVLVEKERISLSIKETKTEPASATDELGLKKGKVVTCVISEVTENGLAVLVGDKVKGFIRRGELARERGEQRPDRFAAGERVDAKIINASSGNREMSLSIRALEIQEEKEAVEAYGSADSGAVLGDILGFSGLTASSDEAAAPAEKEEKPAKAKKKPAKAAAPKADTDEAPAEPVAEEAESVETEPAKDENA
ncbi:MAG: S1 RNA-binding domain-containing protein, partial [Actinomycetia bacterium]|nr:S1 RNA-binding domain-containing protein [Actinomycetes bacterium]